jgi:phage terminase small subunit
MKKLTERQERWAVNYATTGNGTQSAIDAGYSKNIAGVMACRLLKIPEIVAIINRIKTKDEKKLELTRERVLMELAKGLYRDLRGLVDENGWFHGDIRKIPKELLDTVNGFDVEQTFGKDDDGNQVVVGQRMKIRIVPKEKFQDMAMKHLGAYANEDHTVKIGLDWDSLSSRSVIIDPAADAIKRVEEGV